MSDQESHTIDRDGMPTEVALTGVSIPTHAHLLAYVRPRLAMAETAIKVLDLQYMDTTNIPHFW